MPLLRTLARNLAGLLAFFRPRTAALAVLATAMALLAGPAGAAGAATSHLLTVTGSGEASAVPDQARLSAGVVSKADTAAAALADNSRKMTAVFATLKKMGVPDKSIQTSGFSVAPQYPPYNSKEPRRITGYRVSNTVTVELDDMTKLGPAFDALVRSGANQVNNIGFSIRNPKPLLAKARADAVKKAKVKAETIARAAGVTLGPIAAITEGGATPPRPVMVTAMRAAAAPPPVAAGETTLSATVTITWEIH
jgi:uncharacterized protein YggE